MPEAYGETESATDLATAARTTGARLRWDRMSRPAVADVPRPRAAGEAEVGPEAARLADQHVD